MIKDKINNANNEKFKNQEEINKNEIEEPSINILSKLNSIANENFHQIIPPIVCEICYKANNLTICEICKSGFHQKCLGTAFFPPHFVCDYCKKHFNKEEITDIIEEIYSKQQKHNKKDLLNNINSEEKKTIEKTKRTTKIIENNEELSFKSSTKSLIKKKRKHTKKTLIDNKKDFKEMNGELDDSLNDSKINNIIPLSEKNNKIKNMNTKELSNKINNKNNYSSSKAISVRNKSEESSRIDLDEYTNDFNNNNHINQMKSNKKKSLKNNYINEPQKQSKENEKKYSLLLSFTHTEPQYKRRKIKIGINRQCNMYEFTDKYENRINFEEEEIEREDLKQVFSAEKNPLSNEELQNYLKNAKYFLAYKNSHIEENLCSNFLNECDQKIKTKKISNKLKSKINKLIKELKELVQKGIDLKCHYDEISLKILHLCKYKTNIALFILYKGINPFIEEIEEGFKHDVYFFQDEIFDFINNGDYSESDDN